MKKYNLTVDIPLLYALESNPGPGMLLYSFYQPCYL